MIGTILMGIVDSISADSSSIAVAHFGDTGVSWFICQLSLGELLTILVAIGAAWIAIVQYKSSKKDTWFLNVIVLPQLEPLKKYYLELLDDLKKDKNNINENRKSAYDAYIEYLAVLKQQRKDGINDNFDHIVALVRSYDKKIGDKVSTVVMDLEDDYVAILDKYSEGAEVKEREIILANEQKMLAVLNSAMNKQ